MGLRELFCVILVGTAVNAGPVNETIVKDVEKNTTEIRDRSEPVIVETSSLYAVPTNISPPIPGQAQIATASIPINVGASIPINMGSARPINVAAPVPINLAVPVQSGQPMVVIQQPVPVSTINMPPQLQQMAINPAVMQILQNYFYAMNQAALPTITSTQQPGNASNEVLIIIGQNGPIGPAFPDRLGQTVSPTTATPTTVAPTTVAPTTVAPTTVAPTTATPTTMSATTMAVTTIAATTSAPTSPGTIIITVPGPAPAPSPGKPSISSLFNKG